MRKLFRACRFGAALALLLICNRSFAQGCDEHVVDVDIPQKCKGVEIVEQYCESPGTPCIYCYMGYGVCSQTGYEYTTANVGPDDSCGGGSGGCCENLSQCSQDGSGGSVCDTCSCQCVAGSSPIIIDTTGKGFHLTSAVAGVMFDIRGDGRPIQVAWTADDSGNAFLALDRNHNGRV